MEITDKDRLDFLERFKASINYRFPYNDWYVTWQRYEFEDKKWISTANNAVKAIDNAIMAMREK